MNESPKKNSGLATVFFVLSALSFFLVPVIIHSIYNSNVPSYLKLSLGDYIHYRFGELLPYMLVSALLFAGIGFLILKKKPSQTKQNTVIEQQTGTSNADELRKYKELLDTGAITQEEFEVKKKQLLEL